MVLAATQPFLQRGMIVYSDHRNTALARYQGAVKRATFLNEQEKQNWVLLAYFMDENELIEAEHAIINEDLRRMQVRQELQSLKQQN